MDEFRAEISISKEDDLALGNFIKAFEQAEFKLEGAEIPVLSFCLAKVKAMHKGMKQAISFKEAQDARQNSGSEKVDSKNDVGETKQGLDRGDSDQPSGGSGKPISKKRATVKRKSSPRKRSSRNKGKR